MNFVKRNATVQATQYRVGKPFLGVIVAPGGQAFVHATEGKIQLKDGDYVYTDDTGTHVASEEAFNAVYALKDAEIKEAASAVTAPAADEPAPRPAPKKKATKK